MTAEQIEIAMSFMHVVFLPGSWNKRFAQSMIYQARMEPPKELTDAQNEWLYRILFTYRKQVPDVYEKYRDNPLCRKAVDKACLAQPPAIMSYNKIVSKIKS